MSSFVYTQRPGKILGKVNQSKYKAISLWAKLMLSYRNGEEHRVAKGTGVSTKRISKIAAYYKIKRKNRQLSLFD